MGGMLLDKAKELERQNTLKYWQAIVMDQQASGLTIKSYCKKNNLNPNAFYYWLKQIRLEGIESQDNEIEAIEEPQFVSLGEVLPAKNTTEKSNIKIKYGEISIELEGDASKALITDVLVAVKDAFINEAS